MTPDTGQMTLTAVYLSHMLTVQRKRTLQTLPSPGACSQEQSEQVGTMGGRLCGGKRMRTYDFLRIT